MADEFTRREFVQRSVAGAIGSVGVPRSLDRVILREDSDIEAKVGKPRIPGPVTAVKTHLGKPTFSLDGRPYTKPVFETYVPDLRYFQQFAGADTDVYSFSTNLGAGFARQTWLGPDRWDFTQLDEIALRVIEADPRGLIMPRILLSTPDWWMEQNMEEAQVLASGSKTYSASVSMGRAGRAYPSVASAKWRNDMSGGLRRMIAHIQQSDYRDHMFGYIVTGLMTEEWYHWSIHTNELSDYSRHMTLAFRRWLGARYGSERDLRSAWSDPDVSFESVVAPSQEARRRGSDRTFRNPELDMPVIDYYQFYNDVIPETIDIFAAAVKAETGGAKAVGAFYGYMFEFSGDPEFGHNAEARFLKCPNLDFMMVTASYGTRQLGTGTDYMRSPMTSLSLHGKLWYQDNDTVSFRHAEMSRQRNMSAKEAEEEAALLGATDTPQETIWQYERSAGFALGAGVFQSFFDLHGGYFDDPLLMAEIKRLNRLFDDAKNRDCSSAAQILVLADEASCAYCTFESSLLARTLAPFQLEINRLGAPHDAILVDDLDLLDTAPYRLIICLNTFHLTAHQRRLLQRKACLPGKTVLWCYAPGLFQGHTADPAAMQRLTGLRIAPAPDETRVAHRIALTGSEHPLGLALAEACSSVIGPEGDMGKAFAVDDAEASVLGYRVGTLEAALAVKAVGEWTSVYSLTGVLPSSFYRALARYAGVHIVNDRDETLYLSRSYLTVNADGAGERVLHLPRRRDVANAVTGMCLATGATEFTTSLKDKETLILRLD